MAFYKSAEVYYKEMTSTLSDVDTSKHSLLYNALMPAGFEFSYQSLMLDEATKMVFAKSAMDNGYSDYLAKRCLEQGITRKVASIASGIIKVSGVKTSKLPSGSLVSTSLGMTYTTNADTTLDDNGIGYANITASAIGSEYNCSIGDINSLPVKYQGILTVTNEAEIDNGYDIESDEDLYARYLLKIQTPATSGNIYHYKVWALAVNGVGDCKVFEETNLIGEHQNGCVKVVIINSNKLGADETLVNNVLTYIQENRPVGATPYVISATEVPININVNLTVATNYTVATVKASIIDNVTEHLKDIAFKQDYISYAKLGSIILTTAGVQDYSSLLINNGSANINIEEIQIGVVGSVVVNNA